jgi:hypothetical protein
MGAVNLRDFRLMKTRLIITLILGVLAGLGVAYGTPPWHPHRELFHHETNPIEPPVDPKPEPVSPYQLRDKTKLPTGDSVRD